MSYKSSNSIDNIDLNDLSDLEWILETQDKLSLKQKPKKTEYFITQEEVKTIKLQYADVKKYLKIKL